MIRSLFFGVIGPEKIKITTQNCLNTDNRVFDIGILIMHYMMHWMILIDKKHSIFISIWLKSS